MKIENEDWPAEWNEHVKERLAAGLNYLEGTEDWTTENVLEDNHGVMTNVDENGNITSLHNSLVLKETMSLDNALGLFRVYPVGYEENVNTHLYRFYPEEEQTLGTVEWFAMDNCLHNVFVPSYPMLLTDTWEGYKVQLGETEITEEKPDKGDYYLCDGEYHIHPDGWDKSYIGTLSALNNKLTFEDVSEEEISLTDSNFQSLQGEFVSRFNELSKEIKGEPSVEAREEIMTEADMEMASQVHDTALALYRFYTDGETSDLIQGEENVQRTDNSGSGFPVVPLVAGIIILAAAVITILAYRKRRAK